MGTICLNERDKCMAEMDPTTSQAEGCAVVVMYRFRELLQGLTPTEKLTAAKALLKSVRTMVEDLEQGV